MASRTGMFRSAGLAEVGFMASEPKHVYPYPLCDVSAFGDNASIIRQSAIIPLP